MKQKKLMLLGGLRYLLPVIEAAHQQGYYVITVDYLPGNIAHKYSDEYHNVSITDREAVLALARRLGVDGVMSFAVDPGVVTAAYVQQVMGLPAFGPLESVEILQHKDRFRSFLARHGFNVPQAKGFRSVDEAMAARHWMPWPCMVKPTDSAGSKGVTRVDDISGLRPALEWAFANSLSGTVIVEQFIAQRGCSSDSDCFSVDGTLRFVSFSAQRFDSRAAGAYVPAAFSWPSTMRPDEEANLASELQRLLRLLGMRTTIYNVETRVGTDGKPYIMEVSPRGGGNRLAEMVRFATGVDLITAAVRAAVGDTVPDLTPRPLSGHWAEVVLHVPSAGVFRGLSLSSALRPCVRQTDLWVQTGDAVRAFKGANDAIGTLVCQFPSAEQMEQTLADVGRHVVVEVG